MKLLGVVELSLERVGKQSLTVTIASLLFLFSLHTLLVRAWPFHCKWTDLLLGIGAYVVLIILHEIFHLIGFFIFGRVRWSEMEMGIRWDLGVAYATPKKWLTNRQMKRALLLPLLMTGIIPALYGLLTSNGLFLTTGALLIGGAVGDLVMYWQLRSFPEEAVVRDDPEFPRLFVYSPHSSNEGNTYDL